jgi:hypothetical protein
VLFPVLLDHYLLDGWCHEKKGRVRGRVVADFGGWDQGAAGYDAPFKALLEALQAG